ncbi:MAG: transglycosylase domain-containing protein [Bacteroidia bacterium]
MPKKKKSNKAELTLTEKLIRAVWITFGLPFALIILMLIVAAFSDLPSFDELENPRSMEASMIYSIDGEVLGKFYTENRVKVEYHQISPHVVNALIATEDERFENHSGIDANAIARAIFGALTFSNKGGGSTITQQLAKMMFHEPPQTKFGRLRQKFGEWIISARLEKQYTKTEIITMYLNKFDFVYNGVGIHSAAKIYFNTTPDKLNIQQAATLVGMAKNPNIYNPVTNPEVTLQRRKIVLKQMQKNDYINEQEYDSLHPLSLGLDFKPESQNTGLAPYFRAWLKDEVEGLLKDNNVLKDDGTTYSVRLDGLKIYTTIDQNMQQHAEQAVENHLKELQTIFDKDIRKNKNYPYSRDVSKQDAERFIWNEIKKSPRFATYQEEGLSNSEILNRFRMPVNMTIFDWNSPGYMKHTKMSPYDSLLYTLQVLRVGMVAIEPQTGFIKAWVGGPNYRNFKYDYATVAKRQVGSTIKPFVYATAIRDGLVDPCTEFANIEYCIETNRGPWCPNDEFDEQMTPVFCALAGSKNNITTKLIEMTGGNNQQVVNMFRTMSIKNNSIRPVPALGLGVCDMSVLEMTSAQTVFANQGVYVKPVSILRIEDRYGKILYEANTTVKEVLDANTSFEVLKMLKGTMKGAKRPSDGKVFGTGMSIGKGLWFECAGKTGTTQNNSDGWFMGFVPDLVTGVWVGCDNPRIRFNNSYYGQGSRMAAPIWGKFISKVYGDKKIKLNRGDFKAPYENLSTRIDCDSVRPQNNDAVF